MVAAVDFRKWAALGAVVALASLCAPPAIAALQEPVRTEAGMLAGVPGRDPSITVFKGVPFAAPPVGELRWRPPRAPIPWQGVRRASQFGNICPQLLPPSRSGAPVGMNEDCLFLNVWSGASTATERRPVLVWIYGGGFSGGSGSSLQFDGERLARKGLVVVTFNYRLGALGFLATPQLSQESGHHASGNYGILDEIAALRWVHDNIAGFGGDPGRVAIAGQSAGAGSVGFLDGSPLAGGLFQRAIAESHARYSRDPELRYLSTSWRSLHSAEEAGVEFVRERGGRSLQELRAMPWQKLLVGGNVYDEKVDTGSDAKPPLFRPVVDGWVIPFTYSETRSRGVQADVPFIAGNNLDESGAVPETAFAGLRLPTAPPRAGSPQPHVTLADYVSSAKRKYGPLADQFLKLYPASNDDEAAVANNAAVRDNSRVSTFLWATEWTKSAKGPVFLYFWTHRPPGPEHDSRGAYHGSEISYVFDNLDLSDGSWTAEDRRIADVVSSYWANLTSKGDPNGEGLPRWPAFDPKSPLVMELGEHFSPLAVADGSRLEFWRRYFQTQQAW
jgi:para-nitrobenzyl esterase